MDANRLRTGELIAGVAGAALLIVMFFSWFGAPDTVSAGGVEIDVGETAGALGIDTTANAWQSFDFIDIILFVTAATAIGLAVATAAARTVALPVAASAITAGLGILSTILILYRLIDPPEDASRKFGVFLGLIAAAAVAYGGWRSMQEEGTTFAGEADRLGDRVGDNEPPAPPPPPPAPPAGGTGGPPPPGGPTA
jgi:hypothetical protein